jgi:threonine/homoserine/homoserine lactone efflux protein
MLRFGLVAGGLIVTVANPYWSFWWATVGAGRTTEVAALAIGPLAIGGLALVHWLTDLGWLGGWSFLTATGRDVIGDGAYRTILLVCGAFLLAFGAWLGWSGFALLATA